MSDMSYLRSGLTCLEGGVHFVSEETVVGASMPGKEVECTDKMTDRHGYMKDMVSWESVRSCNESRCGESSANHTSTGTSDVVKKEGSAESYATLIARDGWSTSLAFVLSKRCTLGTAYDESVMGRMAPTELMVAAEVNNCTCEMEVEERCEAVCASSESIDVSCFRMVGSERVRVPTGESESVSVKWWSGE